MVLSIDFENMYINMQRGKIGFKIRQGFENRWFLSAEEHGIIGGVAKVLKIGGVNVKKIFFLIKK